MLARYFDPGREITVEREVTDPARLAEVLAEAGRLTSERGTPAVELTRGDGSAVVLARAGKVGVLMWTDAVGSSFHSVGDPDADGLLVVDFLGSYTEIPQMFAVDLAVATAAANAYLAGGRPSTEGLTLEPD